MHCANLIATDCQVLSAEETTERAMDNAANAMAAGRKVLTKEETLGQEASSALLQGRTISDKVIGSEKWGLERPSQVRLRPYPVGRV